MSQVEELVNKAEQRDGAAQAGDSGAAETAEEAARRREHDADELAGQYAASENRIDPNPSPTPTRWTNKETAHRPAPRHTSPHTPSPQPSSSFNDGLDGESLLNKNYTFENFVVGSSNNFCLLYTSELPTNREV